jgi:hypothetical protein
LVVTKLGAADVLHDVEVEAKNWMGALRSGREDMGERASVPPGASCSIDGEGVATVLDPQGRRKFVLSPLSAPGVPAEAVQEADAGAASDAGQAAPGPSARQKKKKRFETVAFVPPQMQPAAEPEKPAGKRKKFQTVAYVPGQQLPGMADGAQPPAAHPPPDSTPEPQSGPADPRPATTTPQDAPPTPASSRAPASQPADSADRSTASTPGDQERLELIFERDDDPSQDNPLCYRERAYLMPASGSVSSAEASLRWELASLQRALADAPRGKLVNLAVFDHRWEGVPARPPLVVLQWRDWRDEVTVDYPAAPVDGRESGAPATASSSQVPERAPSPEEDRLSQAFEALEGLARLQTPVEGLDYVIGYLEHAMPAEAHSAALYDINTDELRFVAVSGTGADQAQGTAIPRAAGLFGRALLEPGRCSAFDDVMVEPAYNPSTDSRPGLDAHNMLLRPVSHDGQLLAVLQVVNCRGATTFDQGDASLLNYVADRLGEFLASARVRPH